MKKNNLELLENLLGIEKEESFRYKALTFSEVIKFFKIEEEKAARIKHLEETAKLKREYKL